MSAHGKVWATSCYSAPSPATGKRLWEVGRRLLLILLWRTIDPIFTTYLMMESVIPLPYLLFSPLSSSRLITHSRFFIPISIFSSYTSVFFHRFFLLHITSSLSLSSLLFIISFLLFLHHLPLFSSSSLLSLPVVSPRSRDTAARGLGGRECQP